MKLLPLFATCWLVCLAAPAAVTNGILAGLRPEHPRLILTGADWTALRAAWGGTNEIAQILAVAEQHARLLLNEPPVVYKKDGKRLLAVSREAMHRIELWSFAYRLTDDKKFLDRAEKEMLTVAAFKDWNPSHFLDVAEMTAGMALGYDWLYAGLPPVTRAKVRQAILDKGLNAGLQPRFNSWQHRDNNWNQVCFGGLTLGALAIADEEPAAAAELLAAARANNRFGMAAYAPDGVYPEGPGYWNYGTGYEVLMISALESALGTDWNLPAAPGFLECAAAQLELTGPAGRPFNFSDGQRGNPVYQPWQFWFAQKLDQPGLVYFQQQRLAEQIALARPETDADRLWPLLAKWLTQLPATIPAPTLPPAWHADGRNPVGVFRTSWADTNALYLAFKGGQANNSHGHMDAGSFVLDAQGVRWAWDLGSQDYLSVESKGWNLWGSSQSSDRWRVFRLNNFSHNTLTLGGKLHNAAGRAEITAFTANGATVDLSAVFRPQAKSVLRHFDFGNGRVVVRDDISGAAAELSVRWQMLTRAAVLVQNGEAVLRQDGRRLRAKIISPAGAQFENASAQPPDDGVNESNPGCTLLQVNTQVPASGRLALEIELRPEPAP